MSAVPDVCVVCRKDQDDELVIFCDGCDKPFHTYCTTGCLCCKKRPNLFGKVPPVPEGSFFCKICAGHPEKVTPDKALSLVYAFGNNEGGQLGIGEEGTDNERKVPTLVEDLCGLEIVQCGLGGWNSFVLTNDGEVYSAGDGTDGKTGHSDVVHEMMTRFRLVEKLTAPNMSKGEGQVTKISAGRDFCYAVTGEGHVYSWGNGDDGKLGHQSLTCKKVPTKISALRELEIPVSTTIATGWSHVHSIESEYGVFMGWGQNRLGQVGAGVQQMTKWVPQLMNPTAIMDATSAVYTKIPEPFDLGLEVREVACGKMHSLALSASGQVWSWGGAATGQLGHGKTDSNPDDFFSRCYTNLSRPKLIEALADTPVRTIAVGGDHSMCVAADSTTPTLYTWGANSFGQLGNGDRGASVWLPAVVKSDQFTSKIVSITAGDNHSACLLEGDKVLMWGANRKGQLGLGDDDDRETPTELKLPTAGYPEGVHTRVYTGGDHTYVIVRTNVKNTKPKKVVQVAAEPAKKGKGKKKGSTKKDKGGEPAKKKAKTATKKKSRKKK